jgi:hypothetical protein
MELNWASVMSPLTGVLVPPMELELRTVADETLALLRVELRGLEDLGICEDRAIVEDVFPEDMEATDDKATWLPGVTEDIERSEERLALPLETSFFVIQLTVMSPTSTEIKRGVFIES